MYLYILELENGRYFLYESTNDNLDLYYFKRRRGIEFFDYFRPIALVGKYIDESPGAIRDALIGYMKEHGIDYVRSTEYPYLELEDHEKRYFEKYVGRDQGGIHPGYGSRGGRQYNK